MQYKKVTLALVLLASTVMAAAVSGSDKPDLRAIWSHIQDGSIKTIKASDIHVTERQLERLRSNSLTIGDVQGILELPVTHELPIEKDEKPAKIIVEMAAADKSETSEEKEKLIKSEEKFYEKEKEKENEKEKEKEKSKVNEKEKETKVDKKETKSAVNNVEQAQKVKAEEIQSKAEELSKSIEDGKIKLSDELIKQHNLSKAQVEELKKATDLTNEKLKTILEVNAGQSVDDGNNNVNNNNGGDGENTGKEPWYKNTWVMVGIGAVVLASLGGGAYMLMGKTNETEL